MHLRLCDTLVSYFIMIFRLVNEWKTKRTAANTPALRKARFYSGLKVGMGSFVRLVCPAEGIAAGER